MMGVFLRELRENAKWAAVICGVLLVICVHEIRNPAPLLLYELANQTTPVMGALAGLLMGVVQSLFEMKPDNWGFAVHRPVPRLGVFVGKCAAGLLLLYAALLLPCAFVAAWAAKPGNLPMHFQFRMVLPMVTDVLAGGCYYFAGMVLMLRRARWQGTRLLPVGLALLATGAITFFIPDFWVAVVLIVLIQAIGAVAAWGVFASNGETDQGKWARVALGVMIYPGALALGMGIMGFIQSFSSGGEWRYSQVDRDGNIVQVAQSNVDGNRTFEFTDAAGKPLPQYERMDPADPAYAETFVRFNTYLADERGLGWPIRKLAGEEFRNPLPGVVRLGSAARPGVRLKFMSLYVVPDGLIELFDPVSHRVIGGVGPAGYSPAGVAAEHFPGKPLNIPTLGRGRVIAFDSVVYWIDMEQRRVTPVFRAAADDPVFYAGDMGPAADPTIAVGTRRGIHVLRPDGGELYSVPLDADPAVYVLQLLILPSNHHLLLRRDPMPTHPELRGTLREYGPGNALVRETEFPRQPEPRHKMYETAAFGLLFPMAAYPVCPMWMLDEVMDLRTLEFRGIFEGCMVGSGILAAAAACWVARRYGLSWRKSITWSVLALLAGPAGIAVLVGVESPHGKEACSACGKERWIGPQPCPACGAVLSADVADGREIFEPADAFAVAQ